MFTSDGLPKNAALHSTSRFVILAIALLIAIPTIAPGFSQNRRARAASVTSTKMNTTVTAAKWSRAPEALVRLTAASRNTAWAPGNRALVAAQKEARESSNISANILAGRRLSERSG